MSVLPWRGSALVGVVCTVVLLAGGCAGSPQLGDQLQPATSRPATASAAPSPTAVAATQQGLGADKFYDLTVKVTNTTGADLELDSATLGHADGSDGGHWDDRATDLPAGGSTTASGYSAIQGQAITLKYSGVIAGRPVTLRLIAQDPAIGSNNTNGTKVTGPVSVQPSITSGRHCTATFTISSYAGT